MPASRASVTSSPSQDADPARLLVVSLSWLGDCVMAMPALAALRRRLPGAHIAMLAKPSVAPLWSMFPAVNEVFPLRKGFAGMRETIRDVRRGGFEFAYILPKSFRAAWVPFVARVPGRRGMPGHGRDWMLTELAPLSATAVNGHQSLEIAEVLHVTGELALPPFLVPSERGCRQAQEKLQAVGGASLPAGGLIAFFPGAAYGPSKRWPAGNFAAVGRRLVAGLGCRILILGSQADRDVCDEVARGIGAGAVNLAGETDFMELTGLLALCRCVVANDSGGMHLTAGLGVPVVGIFGLTDPVKTAPVGTRSRLLCADGVRRSRDLARDSVEARAALESISVDVVLRAVEDL